MKKTKLAPVLALALAGIGGLAPSPAVANAPTVTQSQSQGNEKIAVTPPSVANYRIQRMLSDTVPLMSERRGAIWQGSAKKGNRRTRSRWNYNR